MNGQNEELIRQVFYACATVGNQPVEHNESQPVHGNKVKSYTLAPFPNTLTLSGENQAKKLNELNKDKL